MKLRLIVLAAKYKAALSSSFGAFPAALAVRSMALSSNYSRIYNNQLTPRNTNGSSLTSSRLAWLRATCSVVTALPVLRFASAVTWLDKMSVAAFSCAIEYIVLLWLRPTDTFDLGFANWQVQNVFRRFGKIGDCLLCLFVLNSSFNTALRLHRAQHLLEVGRLSHHRFRNYDQRSHPLAHNVVIARKSLEVQWLRACQSRIFHAITKTGLPPNPRIASQKSLHLLLLGKIQARSWRE